MCDDWPERSRRRFVSPVVRNTLAVIAGFAVGSAVNMSLILVSGNVIPPPAGADISTLEGLRASIHLFEPRHFVFPFLAHALGTLAGAWVAATIAASARFGMALLVGCLFLAGGIANTMMIPAPMWFHALDILAAYIPMAWLGAKLAPARDQRPTAAVAS